MEPDRNLRPLILYTCSIVVVCLNIFNLYLFAWVWSSLNGTGSSATHTGEWAKVDLISSWDTVKFNDKISSKKALRVDSIQAQPSQIEPLKVSSDESVQVKTKVSLNGDQLRLIDLDCASNRISFPSGFQVTAETGSGPTRKSQATTKIVCPADKTHCELEAPTIRFSSPDGLDFQAKSMETRKVSVQRIHSPTRKLSLLSSKESRFASGRRGIKLQALDDIALFSMKSFVSLTP